MKRLLYLLLKGFLECGLSILPFNYMRCRLLIWSGAHIDKDVFIARGLRVDFPWRLVVGANSYINPNVYLDCRGGRIVIGENCDVSEGALVYTLSHNIQSENFEVKKGDVVISDRCWICTRSIILPNSTLASGCVLSANSVYSGYSEANSLLVGIPAKCVKVLNKNRATKVRSQFRT